MRVGGEGCKYDCTFSMLKDSALYSDQREDLHIFANPIKLTQVISSRVVISHTADLLVKFNPIPNKSFLLFDYE